MNALEDILSHCDLWEPRFRRIRHSGERKVALGFVHSARKWVKAIVESPTESARLNAAFHLGRTMESWTLRDQLLTGWTYRHFREFKRGRKYVQAVVPASQGKPSA